MGVSHKKKKKKRTQRKEATHLVEGRHRLVCTSDLQLEKERAISLATFSGALGCSAGVSI